MPINRMTEWPTLTSLEAGSPANGFSLSQPSSRPFWDARWSDMTYAVINGEDAFLIRKCFLINNHTQGETGRHPRWDILARDESYMGGGIHPAHILRCRSLAKAKRAVMREVIAPGHCAMIRRNAARRRTERNDG